MPTAARRASSRMSKARPFSTRSSRALQRIRARFARASARSPMLIMPLHRSAPLAEVELLLRIRSPRGKGQAQIRFGPKMGGRRPPLSEFRILRTQMAMELTAADPAADLPNEHHVNRWVRYAAILLPAVL